MNVLSNGETGMIEKLRQLLFRIFKKESFIGRMIDRFVTTEIILYLFFGVCTTAVNFVAFWLCKKVFASVGWNGLLAGACEAGRWEKFAGLVSDGTEYLDSTVIAWVISVIFAFVTNKLFVFESKSWEPSVALKELGSFFAARIFSFFFELAGMFIFVSVLGMNDYVAKIVVGIVVVIINYVFSKLWIFRRKDEKETGSDSVD